LHESSSPPWYTPGLKRIKSPGTPLPTASEIVAIGLAALPTPWPSSPSGATCHTWVYLEFSSDLFGEIAAAVGHHTPAGCWPPVDGRSTHLFAQSAEIEARSSHVATMRSPPPYGLVGLIIISMVCMLDQYPPSACGAVTASPGVAGMTVRAGGDG
jgi:hypothetical protein